MKKLLITTALAGSLICSPALAENNHSLSIEASQIDVDQALLSATYLGNDDAVLPTIRYGYRFDLSDALFVKPSISYTFGDVEVTDTDGTADESVISKLLTIEADLGYNVTKELSVFATAGLARANLERNQPSNGYYSDANDTGLLLGLGVDYKVTDSVSVNARYQQADIDYGIANTTIDHEIELEIIKIGVSYNF